MGSGWTGDSDRHGGWWWWVVVDRDRWEEQTWDRDRWDGRFAVACAMAAIAQEDTQLPAL